MLTPAEVAKLQAEYRMAVDAAWRESHSLFGTAPGAASELPAAAELLEKIARADWTFSELIDWQNVAADISAMYGELAAEPLIDCPDGQKRTAAEKAEYERRIWSALSDAAST